jgi:hypothetical protein
MVETNPRPRMNDRSQSAVGRRIEKLDMQAREVVAWRAGRIVTEAGRLGWIERRWWAYKASRFRVAWDTARRPRGLVGCQIFFHHSPSNPDFLVLGYVSSHPRASLSSLYCGLVVLDEIARLKGSSAIVAEVTNDRLSDRLLARWGWEPHCRNWRGRHFIKRFYGGYPVLTPFWAERIG